MSQEIEVQIKHLSAKNFSVKISQEGTIGDLKSLVEKESGIKSQEIKLIFKGKILKEDEQKLNDLKIENGSAVHMVHNKPQQQGQNDAPQQQPSQNYQQPLGQQTNPLSQQGMGQNPLSGFGLPQGMDLGNLGDIDQNQMNQMMQNPMMRQMAQNLFSNPDQLRAMIQGNPMLQQLTQSNPMLSGLLNDPAQLSQMSGMLFGQIPNQPQQTPSTPQMPQTQNFTAPPVNFNQPAQPQQPQGNLEETYKEQLDRLSEMGFTNKQLNIQVLQQTYGNVDAAVDRLLNMFQNQIK